MASQNRLSYVFLQTLLFSLVNIQLSHAKDVKPEQHRERKHIEETLYFHQSAVSPVKRALIDKTLTDLTQIYEKSIKPIEEAYKFNDINEKVVTGAEIHAKPMILMVGPWSTGKSTMINYLLGIDDKHALRTGAEPTTSDFTIVTHGKNFSLVEGIVLGTDKTRGFNSLEKFGQGFLERLQGVEMSSSLLEHVTLVDTPGIIENRKQQERGYPFNEVMGWFMERSGLIFVVFDPTKLDVGLELESLFKQLKGRESQIRIILNKADSVATQELMRVYGALFWSLAPLINVTEPPRVYIGSFWNKHFSDHSYSELFMKEEISLLQDVREMILNQVQNKIAMIRQLAVKTKIHATTVNKYTEAYRKKKSVFGGDEELIHEIVENPKKFNIPQSVLSAPGISKYDAPDFEDYHDFFAQHALNHFPLADELCSIFTGCPIDKLNEAINEYLPKLLNTFEMSIKEQGHCNADGTCSP